MIQEEQARQILQDTLDQYSTLKDQGFDVFDLDMDTLDNIHDDAFDNNNSDLMTECKEYKKDLQDFLDIYGDIE